MNKVMKLNVEYYGNYGGDINEIVLLPTEINGVLFEKLEEGLHKDAICLGEIEGKHSDVDGDLDVEIVDLDILSIKEVTRLINNSYFGEFESFFEGLEDDKEEYNEQKVKEILHSYNVEERSCMIKTWEIYTRFIEQLKGKYVHNFKNVIVLKDDYDKVVKLLEENNIKSFD